MARPSRTGSKARKTKARKASTAKGRNPRTGRRAAPRLMRSKRSTISALGSELQAAREQQAATADILKVIASSPNDVKPVFEAIVGSAKRLLGGFSAAVFRFIDGIAYLEAITPTNPAADAIMKSSFPRPVADFQSFTMAQAGRIVQVPDTQTLSDDIRDISRARGFRSMLITPLLREGTPIGLISVTRAEPGPFSTHLVQLLQTFADQAVIAIQNVRLFNEVQAKTRDLEESLQQQTATADVLKVISRSAFDLNSVMNTLTQSAAELCKAEVSALYLREGGVLVARGVAHADSAQVDFLRKTPLPDDDSTYLGRTIQSGLVRNIADVADATEVGLLKRFGETLGFRSILFVPLMRETGSVGVFALGRKQTGQFSQREVELVQTFADQAVIAIENVRLFNEVQQRTRDLMEALTHQTGSANILRVIASSPTDIGPVLDVIVENACELCQAHDAIVRLKVENRLHAGAHYGPIPITEESWPIDRESLSGHVILDKEPIHVRDMQSAEGDRFQESKARALRLGHRTILSVPLVRDDESIGVIILRRIEINPFSDKQIALLQTFADQAAIAIGNVRLFEQLQERTRELATSLDELRAAQDRLVQTEKLASLGQLTAGIAHEIKNPLNFVNNFASLSVELTDELKDVLEQAALADRIRGEVEDLAGLLKDNLNKVVQHGKRADAIVKSMLLHSRESSGERRSSDINTLVGDSLNLAYHGARAEKPDFSISLKHNFDPDAGVLELYPQEMTRALLNLFSNGFYAATKRKTEGGDGTFEPVLSAATRKLDKAVEIRIRDNGIGIPPEVREKMFNPFFTTKPTGEGTGLGLSMTHDIIVKQHGGRIDVETKLGEFTEIIITLPRATAVT